MRHLPEAWLRTAARIGARGDVAQAGAELLGRYAEPHRHYHGLAHLDDVLRNIDELANAARDVDVVRMAAWFHDAVYAPAAPDNEERSARLAEGMLSTLRVADPVAADVARLVRLTATHAPEVGDNDGAVLCDADLAILASDPAGYTTYVRAVRAEYGHLGDAAFARGRTSVLRGLLARDRMFSTETGRSAWEDAARRNVTDELAQLGGATAG
jgi:predicted metal-dependent HD superfamily phosphohydrolase